MDEIIKFVLGVLVLGLLVGILASLWPWHIFLAFGLVLIGLFLGGVKLRWEWEKHQVDIEAKRNRARIVHESDKGALYLEEGRISGYSHVLPQAKVQEKASGVTVPMPSKPGYPPVERPTTPSTFSELVRGGYVAPGSDFVLGFDERSEPIRMSTLTSLGIGGGQGFGKTSTAYLVLLEAVVKYRGDIRFLLIDPHIGVDGEETLYAKTKGLEPYFMRYGGLPNPTGLYHGEGGHVAGWVQYWENEFISRMRGGKGPMWVLVMDEGAAVFSSPVADAVSKLLENINRQARKVNMFAIVISQEWKASRTGGSAMRDSIVTFMLHNMPTRISELLVPSDVARQTPRLRIGEAIHFCQGTDRRGMVPQASVEDAERLVSLYRPFVDGLARELPLLGEGNG